MRRPKYLSPTSLGMFYENRDAFYMQYITDKPPPRPPQTNAMAVGSSFDAYVKSFLVELLLGKDPEFEFETIFENQVEVHNRDEARVAGKEVFEAYKAHGALNDIISDLKEVVGKPRFEASVEGVVRAVNVTLGDVPFLGKPDIFFLTRDGGRVIFDWKVNGYYSNYPTSPKPGYVRIRPGGAMHPKCIPVKHNGVRIAASHPLCVVDKGWAKQLSVYAWLLGEDVGSKFIVAIDQIAVGGTFKNLGQREFRIAQHRSLVTPDFQKEVFRMAVNAWKAIQSGHIFMETTREESDIKCATLDAIAQTPRDDAFDALLSGRMPEDR